ncbi:MAG TPA: hypothetical protein VFP80_14340 [Thermoanaerobaculia bacterium]|nr:hypothetical protein [Thermoanaerobaculia bacterium]
MNIQELDQALPLVGGSLTLDTTSLGGLLQSFLIDANGSAPLVISGASKTVGAAAVTIDGTAPLLHVSAAPVHAVFALQADGSVEATLRWSLPQAWTFSTSFPSLPPANDAVNQSDTSLLDQLVLTDSAFVVSTAAGTDPVTQAPLAAGLNVVAHVTPSGLFGVFETLLGGKGQLTLSAPVLFAQPGVATPPLLPFFFPWQATWPVPGIEVTVPFGVDLTLGSLQMSNVALRIYTPTDTTWLAQNPTYQPALALVAKLDVASAGISADIVAEFPSGGDSAIFVCDFAGVTVSKLAQLTDLVGGADLESILPSEVASALGSLAIERVVIGVTGTLSASAVQYVVVDVGLPGVTWHILDHPVSVSVTNITAGFTVASPFSTGRSLGVSLQGDVSVAGASFTAFTSYPGFATYLELAPDTTVPLQQIFSSFAPDLPVPQTLTIEMLSLLITPGQGFAFSARMADTPPWTIAAGPVSMGIESVAVDVSSAGSAGTTGTFSGTLEFGGGIEVAVLYAVPGTFVIRGQFPDVHLSALIAQLDRIGVPVPSGFDIDLGQAYALIEEENTAFTFSAAALVNSIGLVALTAQKTTNWGFAAGVQLGNGSVSSMPGFGALSAIESFVGLEELMLVVSSLDDPGFSFPDMAAFDAPPLQGHSIQLPPQASGVVHGVNVYAQLSAATNAGFKLLADYLGIRLDGSVGITLAVSAPDPATNSKLFLSVHTNINGSTRLDGELGVLLLNNDPGAFLSAIVQTSIQGQPATFTVTAIVLPTGVLISGTMAGQIHFAPVTLGNVAIEIGIDDAGIPSLGFAATIDIANFESSIAVFFDSTDPSKSMFAGAISDVTLLSIASEIAGQGSVPSPLDQALAQFGLKGIGAFTMPASGSSSLDGRDLTAIRAAFAQGGVTLPSADGQLFFVVNTPGSVWHLTDLSTMLHYELRLNDSTIDVALEPQIYCAPQATTIGALRYPQGIHVIAEVDEFLIKAKIQIEISASTGISVDAGLDPITLFSANLFSVTGASQSGGPLLSMATFTQPQKTDPHLQPPHFLLTGAVHILGIVSDSLYISISADGLAFSFTESSAATSYTLTGSVTSAPALSVSGTASIGIDRSFDYLSLGNIHVECTVGGSVSVSGSASGGSASFQGSFDFEGISYDIPQITLDVTGPALENLADTVWDQIVDILKKSLLDYRVWLLWVKDKLVTFAGDAATAVGNALASVYHLAGPQIISAARDVLGYTLDGVTAALKGAGIAAQDAANLLVSAGYKAEDVAKSIAGIFTGSTHIDFSLGHIDVPAGPHIDTPFVPHLDTPGAPHVDTPSAPHVDIGSVHTDFGTHVDHGTIFGHWDTSIGHFDHAVTPHVDTAAYPHIDTPLYPHIDTPSALHVDTHTPPHVDTGTHVDIP